MNPDPLRPVETDAIRDDPGRLETKSQLIFVPNLGDSSTYVGDFRLGPVLGFLLALACGFIAGVLVMWVLR